jgi:hypothetical protein
VVGQWDRWVGGGRTIQDEKTDEVGSVGWVGWRGLEFGLVEVVGGVRVHGVGWELGWGGRGSMLGEVGRVW